MNPTRTETSAMIELAQRLQALSSAEDFFGFFGLAFDAHVVHVNRLHILKRFRQYLARDEALAGCDEVEAFRRCRSALQQAHDDFRAATAQSEKLFKVFQQAEGTSHVGLQGLRESLREGPRSPARAAA
jgi:nitrogenase-stabilizing/protective protein